jgi:hypothetical protein
MNYETIKFTKRKKRYEDKDSCLSSIQYENTNPKFKIFDQIIFHAGDEYDLERYGLIYAREIESLNSNKKGKYTFQNVLNTINYQFNGFKKGILVVIKDNQLKVFLPFSNPNHNFEDLLEFLYYDDIDRKMLLEYKKTKDEKLYNKIKDRLEKEFNAHHKYRVEQDRKLWGINNCFFRDHKAKFEGDHSITELEYLLELIVNNRTIPDVILCFHVRDFPIMHKKQLHPFTNIVPPDYKIKKEFQNEKYPVFAFSSGYDFNDIPIPTGEDINRISQMHFVNGCMNGYKDFDKINLDWNSKVEKGFFRGSLTGCGTTINDNMRLKVSKMSLENPDLLDCYISKINFRIRKSSYDKPVSRPQVSNVKIGDYKSIIDKSFYKYIVNIDGHSRAYRLGSEFGMNSVVLLQKSPYYLWFEPLLKEYVHYIPIKRDLSDLIEKIKWCKENDDKCKKIASNGLDFFNKYLTKDGILDYMQETIIKIKNNYNPNFFQLKLNNSVAIITLFRDNKNHDRLQQKEFFLEHMPKLIPDVHIYVIEQSEKYLFNIGALKNIGFSKLKKKYDVILFSDIDMIPSSHLVQYCIQKTDGCICLAENGTRYLNTKGLFVGGLININPKLFEKINGFPNNFYGWGAEDSALIIRLNINKGKFYIPKKGFVIDIEYAENNKPKDLELKTTEIKEMGHRNNHIWETLFQEPKNWKINGLNNLEYNLLKEETIRENIYNYIVELPGNNNKYESVSKEDYLDLMKKYTMENKNIVNYI